MVILMQCNMSNFKKNSIMSPCKRLYFRVGRFKWIALQFQWSSWGRLWCGPTRHLPAVRQECPADRHRFVPTTLYVGGLHRAVCPPAHLRIAVAHTSIMLNIIQLIQMCVCLSVGHVRGPSKNGWTDRDAVWGLLTCVTCMDQGIMY